MPVPLGAGYFLALQGILQTGRQMGSGGGGVELPRYFTMSGDKIATSQLLEYGRVSAGLWQILLSRLQYQIAQFKMEMMLFSHTAT